MAIKREKIQPQGIHVSMVDGKARYTQVVTVSGTGKMIFVAGQLARNAQGICVGKGDMRAQIQQVGENIKTCLEAVSTTLADIWRAPPADEPCSPANAPSGWRQTRVCHDQAEVVPNLVRSAREERYGHRDGCL
jgi:hypothetical protein